MFELICAALLTDSFVHYSRDFERFTKTAHEHRERKVSEGLHVQKQKIKIFQWSEPTRGEEETRDNLVTGQKCFAKVPFHRPANCQANKFAWQKLRFTEDRLPGQNTMYFRRALTGPQLIVSHFLLSISENADPKNCFTGNVW